MPHASYPDQPYRQPAPYDWELEGVFDNAEPPKRSTLERVREAALVAGAITVAILAIDFGAYAVKENFFTPDTQDIPAKLPKPVRRETDSAVKVEYGGGSFINEGSGVKIGRNLVLTAGHVVLEGDPRMRVSCHRSGIFNVDTPGPQQGEGLTGRAAVYNASEDMAVLRVTTGFDGGSFAALPTAHIAANPPEKGDPVFFVNYETGGGRGFSSDRYPNTVLANFSRGAHEKTYAHPAEYAGTVIGHEDSDLVIATGQKSYGPKAGKELNTHPGASGGPVFNRAGKVVGEAVEVGSSDRNVYVQLVTQESVRSLVRELHKNPDC